MRDSTARWSNRCPVSLIPGRLPLKLERRCARAEGFPWWASGKHRNVASPKDQPLAADHRGNALISFDRGDERTPPGDAPLPTALVAVWRSGRVLMVFDRYRQAWELPGGRIEEGESPRQAAVRELLEESGQQPDEPLRFMGYAKFVLAPDRRAEYLALFAGHCAEISDFESNEEIAAIRWWDLHEVLPDYVQPLDAYLAALTR